MIGCRVNLVYAINRAQLFKELCCVLRSVIRKERSRRSPSADPLVKEGFSYMGCCRVRERYELDPSCVVVDDDENMCVALACLGKRAKQVRGDDFERRSYRQIEPLLSRCHIPVGHTVKAFAHKSLDGGSHGGPPVPAREAGHCLCDPKMACIVAKVVRVYSSVPEYCWENDSWQLVPELGA